MSDLTPEKRALLRESVSREANLEAVYWKVGGATLAALLDAADERDRLADALARAQGPFACCSHCGGDAIHDVETNEHEVPCTLCQSSIGEVERLRAERDRLSAMVERVRALAASYWADALSDGYGGWSTTARAIYQALDGTDQEDRDEDKD